MPIYEFYCADCNTLYSFFSGTIDTKKKPDCPKCGRAELERRPARFAALTRSADSGEDNGDDPFAGLDEGQMETAMASLEQELGGLDEDNPDPRHLANALRKIGSATGLEMGPKMEEMLSKLEAGADPETLEDEMGDLDDGDESFDEFFRLKKKAAALRRPRVDEELYFF
jgi:putative FmdB family regulatory protein